MLAETIAARVLRSVVVVVAQEFFGVVVGVGAGLAVVEVGWWNPFGVAGFQLAGAPGAAGDEFVVWAAALGQVVHVCGPALGVVGDMVDLAVVAGYLAAGVSTPTIFGVQQAVVRRETARSVLHVVYRCQVCEVRPQCPCQRLRRRSGT